jgi:hypothetical protein
MGNASLEQNVCCCARGGGVNVENNLSKMSSGITYMKPSAKRKNGEEEEKAVNKSMENAARQTPNSRNDRFFKTL